MRTVCMSCNVLTAHEPRSGWAKARMRRSRGRGVRGRRTYSKFELSITTRNSSIVSGFFVLCIIAWQLGHTGTKSLIGSTV